MHVGKEGRFDSSKLDSDWSHQRNPSNIRRWQLGIRMTDRIGHCHWCWFLINTGQVDDSWPYVPTSCQSSNMCSLISTCIFKFPLLMLCIFPVFLYLQNQFRNRLQWVPLSSTNSWGCTTKILSSSHYHVAGRKQTDSQKLYSSWSQELQAMAKYVDHMLTSDQIWV